MRSRVMTLFWGATTGSVLFLGAAWSTASELGPGAARGRWTALVLFFVASTGAVACVLVAGRIVFVSGRAQRRVRKR